MECKGSKFQVSSKIFPSVTMAQKEAALAEYIQLVY